MWNLLFLFCKNAEKCDKIEENSFSLLDITSNKVYNKYRIKGGGGGQNEQGRYEMANPNDANHRSSNTR